MLNLSVCLIAKNEALTIGNCLKSLIPITSEIIVIDTGSSDETINIAKSFGAHVVTTTWENDFSKARNISLSYATKDWILIMDCDEILPESQVPILTQLLTSPLPYSAIQFKIHNIINNKLSSSALVLRLFKNHQGFHFTGTIHEQVSPSILSTHGPDSIASIDFYLEHYGYDDTLVSQSQKSDRNLSLLLSTPETEKNGYYYFVLGNEYSRRSDYVTAMQCFEQSLSLTDFVSQAVIYYPYVVINLSSIYHALGYHTKALNLCKQNESLLPNFKDLYMLQALVHHTLGQLKLSKEYIERYLSCTDVPLFYPSEQYHHINPTELLSTFESLISAPLIFTCLFIKSASPTLVECIRNLHNVSHKIYAFITEADLPNLIDLLPTLENFSLQLIILPTQTPQHFLDFIIQEVKGYWLLLLHENEFIPLSALNLLHDLLTEDSPDFYNLTLFDSTTSTSTSEPRLIHINLPRLLSPLSTSIDESCLVIFQNHTL